MTQNELSSLAKVIPELHTQTLGELSVNDQGERCLDERLPCSKLDAVGFDRVKEDWYDTLYFHQVRSADALYKHGDRYYLIEFKTGGVKNVDVHRKLYDSVIGLLEHRVLTLSECREYLQYVIVSLKQNVFPYHKEMMRHFGSGVDEPWEYAVTRENLKNWDKNDIRKLSGFLVEKIYKLNPSDFDLFVAHRNWSN